MVTLKEIVYDEGNPNEIIDLINFNFDQLISNGYGPTGNIGTSGLSGVVGVQGSVGATGITGSQGTVGVTGPAGLECWSADAATVNNTNIIKPIQLQSYPNLPNVIIGSDLINNRSQLSVGRNLSSMSSNIRLTTSTDPKYFDMSLDNGSMVMGFDGTSTSSKIDIQADVTTLYDSTDSDTFAVFSNVLVDFKKNTIIDKTVNILAGAKFNLNDPVLNNLQPQQDDLIVAIDEVGTLGWRDTTSLATNVANGTVVPILPSEINATNFIMSNNSNSANTTGKGINLYAGWYICHGYTWYKDDTSPGNGKAYQSPVFSEDFGGKTNNTDDIRIQIKEGSNYTVTATSPVTNNFNVGFKAYIKSMMTEFWLKMEEDIQEGPVAGHNNIVISNQSHIVYLGRTDLAWKFVDANSYGSPFTEKSSIYFIEAPKGANGLIIIWSPFSITSRIKRQFKSNDLDATNYNPNNNIGPRMLPGDMHYGSSFAARKQMTIYQNSTQNNWIDITKPIYEGNGRYARKGWYSSQPYATVPGGPTFRHFGYWDGKEWYNTNTL
jgi:hypothetical protein